MVPHTVGPAPGCGAGACCVRRARDAALGLAFAAAGVAGAHLAARRITGRSAGRLMAQQVLSIDVRALFSALSTVRS